MNKSFYSSSVNSFKNSEDNSILGELARNNTFELNDLQRNSWIKQISILKDNFRQLNKGHILFEYSIPRMGKRVDAVLLLDGLVFVLEFKVGEKEYPAYAIDQVLDYSIDLKNFHEQSHNKKIIPILISTEANEIDNSIQKYDDQIYFPQKRLEPLAQPSQGRPHCNLARPTIAYRVICHIVALGLARLMEHLLMANA